MRPWGAWLRCIDMSGGPDCHPQVGPRERESENATRKLFLDVVRCQMTKSATHVLFLDVKRCQKLQSTARVSILICSEWRKTNIPGAVQDVAPSWEAPGPSIQTVYKPPTNRPTNCYKNVYKLYTPLI